MDVAGIDVGLTLIDPTSGVCRTGPSGEVVSHTFIDRLSRIGALGNDLIYSVLAIDAPVLPEGKLHYSPRPCEKVFVWGPFQHRCKCGESQVRGTGQALRRSGVETAHTFAASVSSSELGKRFPRIYRAQNIVEAFPNAFLGVSLDDPVFDATPGRGEKFDWLYDAWLRQQLPTQLQSDLAWPRDGFWQAVRDNRHHDERAALVCAITAICVVRGSYVAVGEPSAGYFFLPPWNVWAPWARATLDTNRGDARLPKPVEVWIDGACYGRSDRLPE